MTSRPRSCCSACCALPLLACWLRRSSSARGARRRGVRGARRAPSVAPRGPGWRRHLPARVRARDRRARRRAPRGRRRRVAVPVEQATIVLVMDHSRLDDGDRRRAQPARSPRKRAGEAFLDEVPREGPRRRRRLQPRAPSCPEPDDATAADAQGASTRMTPSGGTATGEGLALGARVAAKRARAGKKRRRPRSSCCPTARRPAAAIRSRSPRRPRRPASRSTRSRSAPSGTIRCPRRRAAATRCRPTRRRCAQIALVSGGKSFTAADAEQLSAVYKELGSQLGTQAGAARGHGRRRRRRAASLLLAGAALVLRAGSAAST